MSLVMRTALLQARVTPEIKQASEHVLRQIGLNMTEAMELFLRRVIVDQRIPFEVIALDDAALASATTQASDAATRLRSNAKVDRARERKTKKYKQRE